MSPDRPTWQQDEVHAQPQAAPLHAAGGENQAAEQRYCLCKTVVFILNGDNVHAKKIKCVFISALRTGEVELYGNAIFMGPRAD